MKKTFYSNGKLLITGEYLVLDGAKALALPTKFGQNLIVEPGNNQTIYWKSYDQDNSIWFEDTIAFEEIKNKSVTDSQNIKNTLITILHEGYKVNPDFINKAEGYLVETHLSFPRNWGLGTSSTLINNIAQWLQIDAFELLKLSFGGSGYDIACAQNNTAIIYQLQNQKPRIENIIFNPDFSDKIYFVYLNKKQNSKTAIANYYSKQNSIAEFLPEINRITKAILLSKDLEDFSKELQNHESILSQILETPTIKETLFQDFNGVIKSLGAWGGDFVMVVSKENPTAYFKSKGYEINIPFKEMIL